MRPHSTKRDHPPGWPWPQTQSRCLRSIELKRKELISQPLLPTNAAVAAEPLPNTIARIPRRCFAQQDVKIQSFFLQRLCQIPGTVREMHKWPQDNTLRPASIALQIRQTARWSRNATFGRSQEATIRIRRLTLQGKHRACLYPGLFMCLFIPQSGALTHWLGTSGWPARPRMITGCLPPPKVR